MKLMKNEFIRNERTWKKEYLRCDHYVSMRRDELENIRVPRVVAACAVVKQDDRMRALFFWSKNQQGSRR